MSERDRILEHIRTAAGRPTPHTDAAEAAYRAAVSGSAPAPQWHEDRRSRFLARLEAAAATWADVPGPAELPEAIGAYLAEQDLPRRIHAAPHPLLDGLAWPAGWQVSRGIDALAEAVVTVTVAHLGIAETGTLMAPGEAQSPPSMNLLSEHHLVVLRADALVDYQEQAWAAYRAESAALPRSVMLITGPSRTADIEQTLQLGAHGPRQLHVLLVGDAPGASR